MVVPLWVKLSRIPGQGLTPPTVGGASHLNESNQGDSPQACLVNHLPSDSRFCQVGNANIMASFLDLSQPCTLTVSACIGYLFSACNEIPDRSNLGRKALFRLAMVGRQGRVAFGCGGRA